MSYLFVNDKGAEIHLNANYVEVKLKNNGVRRIPIENLEAIYMFDYVQITSQCIVECFKKGISISYFSKGGSYFGRLQSTGHVNTFRQRQQIKLSDTDFSLKMAQKIIKGKIHNQIVILRRYARSRGVNLKKEILSMQLSLDKIDLCKTINEIIGYEGNAARIYFQCLGKLVDDDFKFEKRSRRPPLDEFNSMLSLGYSILMNEIYSRVENKGLNPYFGFIHQDKEKHPTLVSDIIEEWRAVIIDSMVMSLVNGHEIGLEHFSGNLDEPGIYLTREGLNIFLHKYDTKMQNSARYLPYIDYSATFRHSIDLQINCMVKAIETGNIDEYNPIWLR